MLPVQFIYRFTSSLYVLEKMWRYALQQGCKESTNVGYPSQYIFSLISLVLSLHYSVMPPFHFPLRTATYSYFSPFLLDQICYIFLIPMWWRYNKCMMMYSTHSTSNCDDGIMILINTSAAQFYLAKMTDW